MVCLFGHKVNHYFAKRFIFPYLFKYIKAKLMAGSRADILSSPPFVLPNRLFCFSFVLLAEQVGVHVRLRASFKSRR
jgi:hypothetical protein